MTFSIVASSDQLAVSDLFVDSGFFSEDNLCLERLFTQEVVGQASKRQKPAKLCKKIWRVENPESFERARQMKALIKEAKGVLALSPKEYELIRSYNAQGKQSEIEKILDEKWSHLLGVAKQLKGFGYYVFLHSASFDISLLIQMQTYLKQGRDVMGSSPSWDVFRRFRENPGIYLEYKNTDDYLRSDLRAQIDDPTTGVVDGWPNNQWLLSCDGFLENKDKNESAFSFYKGNFNFTSHEDLFRGFFKSKFGASWASTAFGSLAMENLVDSARYASQTPLVQGQGQVYLMAIPKEKIEDEYSSYVYRSHPFGRVCDCIAENHQEFVEELKQDQAGNPRLCQIGDEGLMLNPQYRMLIENFDEDSDKIVLSFDGLTEDQTTNLKENYFWPVAFVLKQLTKLSLCELSCEQLESVLEVLPFDLSYWARRVDLILKQFIEQNLEPAYQLAVDQLVREKKDLLEDLKEELCPTAREKLDVLLSRLPGLEERMISFLQKNPSSINLVDADELAKLFSFLIKDQYPQLRGLIQQIDRVKFKEIIRGQFGDVLMAKAFKEKDMNVAAKMIASEPHRFWDFPEDVDLEDLFLTAIEINSKVICELPFEQTEEFTERAIRKNYDVFCYIDPKCENYKKLALSALEVSPDAFKYVDEFLQNDPEIIQMRDSGSLGG